jgi:translation initiation factor 2 alpha subunit (eIF-2alpha)
VSGIVDNSLKTLNDVASTRLMYEWKKFGKVGHVMKLGMKDMP